MAGTEQRPTERDAWLALGLIPEVGAATFHRLVKGLGSAEAVLRATVEALEQVPGISREVAQAVASFPWRDALDRELRVIETRGLGQIRFGDEGYPELLAAIYSPRRSSICGARLDRKIGWLSLLSVPERRPRTATRWPSESAGSSQSEV